MNNQQGKEDLLELMGWVKGTMDLASEKGLMKSFNSKYSPGNMISTLDERVGIGKYF